MYVYGLCKGKATVAAVIMWRIYLEFFQRHVTRENTRAPALISIRSVWNSVRRDHIRLAWTEKSPMTHSFAEIAEILGISENNAKVHFHHAVKRLKALVSGGRQE